MSLPVGHVTAPPISVNPQAPLNGGGFQMNFQPIDAEAFLASLDIDSSDDFFTQDTSTPLPSKMVDKFAKSFVPTLPKQAQEDFKQLVSDKNQAAFYEGMATQLEKKPVDAHSFLADLSNLAGSLQDKLSMKAIKQDIEERLPSQPTPQDLINALKQGALELRGATFDRVASFVRDSIAYHENTHSDESMNSTKKPIMQDEEEKALATLKNMLTSAMALASARKAAEAKKDEDDSVDEVEGKEGSNDDSAHITQFSVNDGSSGQGDSSDDDQGQEQDLEKDVPPVKTSPSPSSNAPKPISFVVPLPDSGDVMTLMSVLFLINAQLVEVQLRFQMDEFQKQNAYLQDLNNMLAQLNYLTAGVDDKTTVDLSQSANYIHVAGAPEGHPELQGTDVSLADLLQYYNISPTEVTNPNAAVAKGYITTIRGFIDQANSTSQMQMFQLQDVNNKRSSAYDAGSSLVKKWGDLASRIIQNF